MEFIKFCSELFLYISISIYIYCALVFTLTVIFEGIERLVNWIGNKISEIRTTKSIRK